MRGGTYDHAEHDETRAEEADVAAAEEVGEGADEGTDSCEGEEVGEDEPDPSIVRG